MRFACLCAMLILMLAATGCDSTPGVREETAPPAFVPGSFSFSPSTVESKLDDRVQEGSVVLRRVSEDKLEILAGSLPPSVGLPIDSFHAEVQVRTPGRMDSVNYVVRYPIRVLNPVATGALHPAGGRRWSTDTTIVLPAALPGLYTVEIYGVSTEGRLARQKLSGSLQFDSGGGPPVVENVSAPDTAQVLSSKTSHLPIRATVSDPQGLLNVGRVELRAPGGATYPMRDDGGGQITGSGDDEAGDGTFSTRYPVEPNRQPGASTFTVVATDRTGKQSSPASFDITFTQQ